MCCALDTMPSALQWKFQEVQAASTCKNFAEFADMDENTQICTSRSGETRGACYVSEKSHRTENAE